MDRSAPHARYLFGGLISLLGVLLAGIVVYDIYADIAIQDSTPYTTIIENSLLLVLDGLIVGSGFWLVRNENVEVTRQAVLWSGVCVAGLLLVSVWVYGMQLVQGQISPVIILTQIASMAILAGIFFGVYSGRRAQRERQLEALFENSGNSIAKIRFENDTPTIQDVNPQFEETFGYRAAEIQGESIDDVIVDSPGREAAAELSQRARAGERYETTVERMTATGESRVFRLQTIPISAGTMAADGYAVYSDVTASHRYTGRVNALHQATRELFSTETRDEVAQRGVRAVSNILGLPLSGVFIQSGSELQLVAISEAANEVFDEVGPLEQGEAVAWEVYESEQPRNIGDITRPEPIQNSETPVGAEMIIPLPDYGVLIIGDTEHGNFSEAEFTLAQILGSNIVAAMNRVSQEEELRNREQELAEQNRRLELFTSVVSHDLRNPLSVATGYVELAREDTGESESLEHIADALDRMDTMIGELLTLARQGDSALSPEHVEVRQIATAAWNTTETGDATLETVGEGSVTADRNRIQQLLENLFRNAVDHGGEEVQVTVGPIDDRGFFVADTGPGVPAGDREEIFEYGYTTSDDGAGFGLTIVKEIVDAHDGTISVTEAETGGARFEVRGIDVEQ